MTPRAWLFALPLAVLLWAALGAALVGVARLLR